MKEKTPRGAGREILVSSAKHLFMRNGTANVGINDVTAEAGLAKMTLYNNFPSKDALIAEVYQRVAEEILAMCRQTISESGSEQEKVISLFNHAVAQKASQRGCPMNHALFQSAEPDGEIFHIVQKYKRQLRQLIVDCLNPGRINRQQLADQILILLDGFALQTYIKAVDSPGESVRVLIAMMLSEDE